MYIARDLFTHRRFTTYIYADVLLHIYIMVPIYLLIFTIEYNVQYHILSNLNVVQPNLIEYCYITSMDEEANYYIISKVCVCFMIKENPYGMPKVILYM